MTIWMLSTLLITVWLRFFQFLYYSIRDEMSLATKAILLKTQYFGFYYPLTKLLTYIIGTIAIRMGGNLTLDQTVRVIGLMEFLRTKTSYEMPFGAQCFKEAVMSLKRIQVNIIYYKNWNCLHLQIAIFSH